ncbi:MAG: 1-deoxy-D-xylulose-5-phosphate reductoisomerase [Cyanobacteria bacterium SZAS LIN-3]|nr:1-deoxy-D-xylulose-5-phosphate reductoisomerase [Cyanobacteria bacterium SZAS LIN-3]
MNPKRISIIGSTGSIGTQTLDIARAHKDLISVRGLAAGSKNLQLLCEQIKEFRPALVSVPDAAAVEHIKNFIGSEKLPPVEIIPGMEGLVALAEDDQSDVLVTAVVGFLGVKPTLAAIKRGKIIALANKETMVAAGHLVVELAAKHSATIVPVDSEHSAIFQSLLPSLQKNAVQTEVAKLLLTGSGGPFRTWSKEQMESATREDALKHPNWSMGAKITIDSATMMNKGLEIIEARWLFNLPVSKIQVVIHPQSILHSAVEFVDGSIVGQMGLPDMRLPIHYALFYPDRVPSERVPRMSLAAIGQLTFEEPDLEKFPCLALAREAATVDDSKACVLNGANEIVVDSFLKGEIKFVDIPRNLERVLSEHKPIKSPSLEDILDADQWARERARLVLTA